MYHGIDVRQTDFILDDPSLVISTKNFAEQIKFLSKSYNIITAKEMAVHIKKKIPFPPNSAVITFDDGLKNNFVNAFPILQKYNTRATIFLTTGYIDTLKINWSNKYYYFINKIGLGEFLEEFKKEFSAYSNSIPKTNPKNITENINFIFKYKINDDTRGKFMQRLYHKFGIKINEEEIKNLYLSWEEIMKMADAGISFGSHTSTHPVLSVLDYEEAEKEIACSKKDIESRLNKNVDLFAYPYGNRDSFNSNTKKILDGYNFLCAVSTNEGLNNLNSDLYELKRISMVDEPLYYFKLRIEGFEGLIEDIQHRAYRYFKKIRY